MIKFLRSFRTLVFFLILSEGVGVFGSLFTFQAIPTWYAHLNKPSFSPPDFVFAPVWTALYFMIGLAGFFVFRKGYKKKQVKSAMFLFGLQLALNVLWSIIFFGLKMPTLALVEIVVLFCVIALTMRQFFKVSETAMFLLVPYLLWVFFASLLNCAIVILN